MPDKVGRRQNVILDCSQRVSQPPPSLHSWQLYPQPSLPLVGHFFEFLLSHQITRFPYSQLPPLQGPWEKVSLCRRQFCPSERHPRGWGEGCLIMGCRLVSQGHSSILCCVNITALGRWFANFFWHHHWNTINISRAIQFYVHHRGRYAGTLFGIISVNACMLYWLPIKFDPRFSPCPPKEITPTSPLLIIETGEL
jgi:hypothetical protein